MIHYANRNEFRILVFGFRWLSLSLCWHPEWDDVDIVFCLFGRKIWRSL